MSGFRKHEEGSDSFRKKSTTEQSAGDKQLMRKTDQSNKITTCDDDVKVSRKSTNWDSQKSVNEGEIRTDHQTTAVPVHSQENDRSVERKPVGSLTHGQDDSPGKRVGSKDQESSAMRLQKTHTDKSKSEAVSVRSKETTSQQSSGKGELDPAKPFLPTWNRKKGRDGEKKKKTDHKEIRSEGSGGIGDVQQSVISEGKVEIGHVNAAVVCSKGKEIVDPSQAVAESDQTKVDSSRKSGAAIDYKPDESLTHLPAKKRLPEELKVFKKAVKDGGSRVNLDLSPSKRSDSKDQGPSTGRLQETHTGKSESEKNTTQSAGTWSESNPAELLLVRWNGKKRSPREPRRDFSNIRLM